jgi:hypothetical protein
MDSERFGLASTDSRRPEMVLIITGILAKHRRLPVQTLQEICAAFRLCEAGKFISSRGRPLSGAAPDAESERRLNRIRRAFKIRRCRLNVPAWNPAVNLPRAGTR